MALSEHNQRIADHCNSLTLEYQVLSGGSPSSQIAIIAEFPGETEVQLKQPLVGGSGALLFREFNKIGIRREQCYLTNVVKRKLTEEKNTNKKVIAKEELEKWHAVLRSELEQLPNVRYVVILGNVALSALTGHTGIKKWRGSALPFTTGMGFRNNGMMLVTYNPAFIMRDPTVEVHFRIDMERLKRVYDGNYKPHNITAIINPSLHEALAYLRQLRAARLPISFDIETIGNETACIGFANNAHEGICINFRTLMAASAFSVQDETTIRLAIAETFADPSLTFIAQNGNFDAYWLRYKDRILAPVYYDTLLAHHTLAPTLPHSLAFLTTQYTEHPYYKDEGTDWKNVGDINKFWEYNVKDCCITRAVFNATRVELEQQKLDRFFYDHVMRLQPHLVEMTTNGILQDASLKETIADDLTKQLDTLEREVVYKARVAASDPNLELNPRSATQLRSLFFDRLKFVGRGTSTDESNRQRIRMHPNTSVASKEFLNALDRYKEEHKFYSVYVDTRIDEDGRARSEWKQWGTQSAPGRLSSSQVMWESGTNFQNQPDRAKEMYVAPPGYGFVYFDLSKAESRYVAVAWKVKKLQEIYEMEAREPGKWDTHRLVAANMFRMEYDDIPATDFDENHKPTKRYQGKRFGHGCNYRLGPDKAAIKFGLSLAEASLAHRLYHQTFPEIAAAWREILASVKRDKVLYNCFGRRWILLTRLDTEEALDSIVAFEPQSSIGDKVCQVIYQAHDDPRWPRSKSGLEAAVTLNIHDAVVATARLDDMEQCARILKSYAEEPLIVRGQELVIPADVGLSVPDANGVHRWSTIEKVKLE